MVTKWSRIFPGAQENVKTEPKILNLKGMVEEEIDFCDKNAGDLTKLSLISSILILCRHYHFCRLSDY